MPPDGHPLIANFAFENSEFRLSTSNQRMPPSQDFLKLMEDVSSVIESPLKPHFTVLQMPIAVLHNETRSKLLHHMLDLLEDMEQSISLHFVTLKNHGIYQDRQILVLVSSSTRYPGLGTVGLNAGSSSLTLHELLKDLEIDNSNLAYLAGHDEAMAMCSTGNGTKVYNHDTGKAAPVDQEDRVVVDIESSDAVHLSAHSAKSLVHKGRGDLLTVQELARIQGFQDDFLFYGPPEMQTRDVLAAQPPAVSKAIAKMIRRVIEFSTEGQNQNSPNKRARVDG
ncbi:hypothetical protein OQA88_12525 [Cercophora sp. LCS_1]